MARFPTLPRLAAAFVALLLAGMVESRARAGLRVPASTAYLDPDPDAADVSASGIRGWNQPGLRILWFGLFRSAGDVDITLMIRPPAEQKRQYRMTLAGTSRVAEATGQSDSPGTAVRFGTFAIPEPGYHRIALEAVDAANGPLGDVDAILLDGPAAERAHFNPGPRRNAASVHLNYPTPPGLAIEAFHTEIVATDEPLHTFYMACGFHRGYLGMQVNGPSERRIIFSVWDSGNEATDRAKVAREDRVELVQRGDGVVASDFGNEGTGGHSHLVHPWKAGVPQRFLVTAVRLDESHTVYSGYYQDPGWQEWKLISSWKAPGDGGFLRQLHSFSENFWGSNGHLRRKAAFGSQWLRTTDGHWRELTRARFTHDPTGVSDRLDRFMAVQGRDFELVHGGFGQGFTIRGSVMDRQPSGHPPAIPEFRPAPVAASGPFKGGNPGAVRAALQSVMGTLPGPDRRGALDVEVTEEVDCGAYVRRTLTYRSEPGMRVPAYLLIPRRALADPAASTARRFPGMLTLHQTHAAGQKVVVGLANSRDDEYGVELARRGYVCLAPPYPHLAGYEPDLSNYASGTMKAVWDNIRGLDLLETLPFVATNGFGTIGHSLGGHNSLFTAAFDPRIRVVVSSCGLDSFRDYYDGNPANWLPNRGWCQNRYMPRLASYALRLDEIPFDFDGILAAIAPAVVFISAPLQDDNFRWQSVDRVVAGARIATPEPGGDPRLRVVHPQSRHRFPPEIREEAYRVLDEVLLLGGGLAQ